MAKLLTAVALTASGLLLAAAPPAAKANVPGTPTPAPATGGAATATGRNALAALIAGIPQPSGPQVIRPGEIWPDNRGQHIQAHGGGIVRLPDTVTTGNPNATGQTYFWFGEQRAQTLGRGQRAVACYASKDLARWTYVRDVLTLEAADFPNGLVLERPKVYYNEKTRKFVMYVHLDDNGYRQAEVGVAVADTVDGPYLPITHFRPLGKESRDIGQFIDDDGTAYLIFEERPTRGFHIAKLSDDYLTVEKSVAFFQASLEGGAVVHYNDLYYVLGSALTGWNPNPNKYASAPKIEGPWSAFRDIAPPEKNTYGSQSTMLVKVVGTRTTSVIFMGDMWRPQTHWDGRYLWMPLEIGNGRMWLPEPREWTLDIVTGEAVINKDAPAMNLSTPASRGARGRGAQTTPPAGNTAGPAQ